MTNSSSNTFSFCIVFLTLLWFIPPFVSPESISFPSHGLHPSTALTWDPFSQHFLAGSFPNPPSILCITESGVAHLLLTDPSLPPNSTFFGLSVDPHRRRLLAVLRSTSNSSQYLASYDLRTRRRLFLAQLPGSGGAANVAVDVYGTAYVTETSEDIIWKVTLEGYATVFSRSPLFRAFPVIKDGGFGQVGCGLNGIAYVGKGYLLVVQSKTGKMFKVKEDDGSARVVELTEDVAAAEGVVVRRDGVVVIMGDCRRKVWFLRSYDSWGSGVVYDTKGIDEKKAPMAVAAGGGDKVYVLYGHGGGGEGGAEGKSVWYKMEEIVSSQDSGEEDEHVWIFILVGLGLVYFWVWRFQMGRLFVSLNRKNQ